MVLDEKTLALISTIRIKQQIKSLKTHNLTRFNNKEIIPGDFVKITFIHRPGNNGVKNIVTGNIYYMICTENVFIKITDFQENNGIYIGVLSNAMELQSNSVISLKLGDKVVFKRKHIMFHKRYTEDSREEQVEILADKLRKVYNKMTKEEIEEMNELKEKEPAIFYHFLESIIKKN